MTPIDKQVFGARTHENLNKSTVRRTRYVIPFISKSYVQKDWTQFEFDTAKREQKKRRSEFILPVRLDDSRLLGLPDQVVTIDARERTIAQIARLVIEKCRSIQYRHPNNRQRAIRNISINLWRPIPVAHLD